MVSQLGTCRKCNSETQVIALWDGNDYCDECVNRVSSRLTEVACVQPFYKEEMPFTLRELMLTFCTRFAITVAVVSGLLTLGALGNAFDFASAAILSGLFFVVAAVLAPLYAYAMHMHRPSVVFDRGNVLISHGSEMATCPLTEISWDYGNLRESFGMSKALSKQVILIFYPSPRLAGMPITIARRVACGWSLDSQRILTAFFDLAGVAKGRQACIAFRSHESGT